MRALLRLIDGLDELNRALVLLYLEGHTSEEIAEIVGISPGNATTRMSRLKSQLQRGFARLENFQETTT
jgi:RNA polymerase sigma-70 factor (ECF subfamily)